MPRRKSNITPLEAETAPIPALTPGLHKKPGKRLTTVNELIDHNLLRIIDIELYRCLNLKDGRACEYLLNRRFGLPKVQLEALTLNINADELAKQLATSNLQLQDFLQLYSPGEQHRKAYRREQYSDSAGS